MKLSHWAWACALSGCLFLGDAMAQGLRQPFTVEPAGFDYNRYLADDSSSPSDQPAPVANSSEAAPAANSCNTCCPSPCSSSCGLNGMLDNCCHGDAFSLSSYLFGDDFGLNFGGWTQLGYTNGSTGLFNSHPDNLNLHQQWFYLEKTAEATACSWDWGFRADVMYGVDAADTQAFGNSVDGAGNARGWDTGWNHGIYGFALPQLYGEVAYGDLSVKVGHFYTLIGYEVVTAPDNFFFSHAYTMNNSEPFTHTGAIGTYSLNDNVTVYGGWTLGWDTGFDQFDEGSNFLGGVSLTLTDEVDLIYMTTIGDFGARGSDGYMHSLIFDVDVTDRLNYVFQSDLLQVDSTGENTIGINQYLFYTINDCWAIGNRTEWWKNDLLGAAAANGNVSNYETTFGLNYRPNANFVVRPEIRHDWTPAADFDQTIFGVDFIATY